MEQVRCMTSFMSGALIDLCTLISLIYMQEYCNGTGSMHDLFHVWCFNRSCTLISLIYMQEYWNGTGSMHDLLHVWWFNRSLFSLISDLYAGILEWNRFDAWPPSCLVLSPSGFEGFMFATILDYLESCSTWWAPWWMSGPRGIWCSMGKARGQYKSNLRRGMGEGGSKSFQL